MRSPLRAGSLRAGLLTLTAGAVAIAAVAAASPADTTSQPPTADFIAMRDQLSQPVYTETITESYRVPMYDGEELYVEVTRPDPAAYPDETFPVVMEASPYHGTVATRIGDRVFPDPKDEDGNNLGLTGWFAPRGYAVAIVDLRGTGRSSGCLDHLGPNDARDLHDVVEWAANAEWSTGRVGMTGHSYVGSTPSVAAAQAPEGLVTIAPSAGLASMYDHQFHNGVPWLLQYVGPMVAYEGLALGADLPPGTPSDGTVVGPTGDNPDGDPDEIGCGYQNSALLAGQGQITGEYQDWHAVRDHRDGAAKADIPIFIIHGVNDNAARIPAAEWFFGDRTPNPQDKVWIGQWDHGSGGNTICGEAGPGGHPNCRFDQWKYALTAWFDKHLKQLDVDTGPSVEAFLNGGVVHTEDLWDRDGAEQLELYLDAGSMTLSTTPPDATSQAAFAAGSYVLTDDVLQTLEFTSEPFAEDTVFLGLPELQLQVSTTQPVTHLVTTLYRVDEGGQREPMNYCAANTHLRNNVATPSPVVPGVPMTIDLNCFTMAHHVSAGDSLVLEIGTGSEHHATTFGTDAIVVHTGPTVGGYELPMTAAPTVQPDVERMEDRHPMGEPS